MDVGSNTTQARARREIFSVQLGIAARTVVVALEVRARKAAEAALHFHALLTFAPHGVADEHAEAL